MTIASNKKENRSYWFSCNVFNNYCWKTELCHFSGSSYTHRTYISCITLITKHLSQMANQFYYLPYISVQICEIMIHVLKMLNLKYFVWRLIKEVSACVKTSYGGRTFVIVRSLHCKGSDETLHDVM